MSGWLVGCPERLLLAALPALRLPMKLRFECFDPFPMLSASAAVIPLSPVPEGVCASFACEGMSSKGCLPSAVEDVRGGTMVCEPGELVSGWGGGAGSSCSEDGAREVMGRTIGVGLSGAQAHDGLVGRRCAHSWVGAHGGAADASGGQRAVSSSA